LAQKNRVLIAITVTLLVVVAMFASFGPSLFTGSTPQVVLPTQDASQSNTDPDTSLEDHENQFLRVEVTPGTVQSVIASLSRSTSYYREVLVENFWEEGSSTITTVRFWTDGGWSHITQTLPSGLIRHDLVGEGQVYYWYDGEESWLTAPADESAADIAQHIPTYETVLDLEPESITATGYDMQGELPCIYVQVQQDVDGYIERYWISVDSGLLVRAEALEHDTLVYSMTALTPIQTPGPVSADTFTLPDGTVLHTP